MRGKKTGGRVKGTPNKATVQRELDEAAERERQIRIAAEARVAEAELLGAPVETLDKSIAAYDSMMDLLGLYMGLTRLYQPWPEAAGKNPKEDEARFRYYSERAHAVMGDLIGYQRPKLSAVVVGSAIVNRVEVSGGLPDEEDGGFEAATEQVEEAVVVPIEPPKAVNE